MSRHARDHRMARPYWGLRTSEMVFSWPERARALLPRLPAGARFSHGTAALIWNLPVPLALEREMRPHVTVDADRRAMDSADIIGHAMRMIGGETVVVDGIPVSSPARLWRELSAQLLLPDLVALGDAILHRDLATGAELARSVAPRGFRGRQTAHAALVLLDARAESPPESKLRVALLTADLPAMLVNEPLYDATGRFVARTDLRFRDYPIAIEYDGDGHRSDPRQWRKDVRRFAEIEDAGVEVIRATGEDLPSFERIVRRARARLARHGWSPT